MSATAQANGHAPVEDAAQLDGFDQAVDRETEALRGLLDEQRSITQQLTMQLDAQKAREKRIEKALSALVGEPPATARPRRQAPSERKQYASAEAIATVYEALVELGGEQRQIDLVTKTGLSSPTIAKSLDALREQERVRIARVKDRSKYYAPMPEATPEAAS